MVVVMVMLAMNRERKGERGWSGSKITHKLIHGLLFLVASLTHFVAGLCFSVFSLLPFPRFFSVEIYALGTYVTVCVCVYVF